jgi:hypothetical protein
MIANPGETISVGGKSFTVGGEVWANDNSDYAGLLGIVTEIRDGEYKETDNNSPDIYCCFKAPASKDFIKELEDRFSGLHGTPKVLGDIPLDSVIMAPDMLEPVATVLPEESEKLYALCVFNDGESGTEAGTLGISKDISVLLRLMSDDVGTHIPLTLTTSTVESEYMRFAYESTNLCDEELYVGYTIAPVSVYPAGKGGFAA